MHPGCVQTLRPVFQQQWSPVSGEPRTDKRSKEVPAGPWWQFGQADFLSEGGLCWLCGPGCLHGGNAVVEASQQQWSPLSWVAPLQPASLPKVRKCGTLPSGCKYVEGIWIESMPPPAPPLPPGSMFPPSLSILFSFSVLLCPAKTFLLLKMKLEPKGEGGGFVAKDDTEKCGSWWQLYVSPAGQNPSNKYAESHRRLWYPQICWSRAALRDHCVPVSSCYSGATQTPGTFQPPSPGFLPFFFLGLGALLSCQHLPPCCECPSPILERFMSFGGAGFKAKRFFLWWAEAPITTPPWPDPLVEACAVRFWASRVTWGGSPWVLSESSALRGVRTNVSAQVSLTKRQALQGEASAKIHSEALNWRSFFWQGFLAHWAELCQKAIWALTLVLM